MAGDVGAGPTPAVLETAVLAVRLIPVNYQSFLRLTYEAFSVIS